MNKTELKRLVKETVESWNPYIKNSIEFFVDKKARYIFHDEVYTKEELDAEYSKTVEKDIVSGYNDRIVGYYDKWYRYNRQDSGRAYDKGVMLATKSKKCVDECYFIEVIEATAN